MARFNVAALVQPVAAQKTNPCSACSVRQMTVCAVLDDDDQRRLASIMTQHRVEEGRTIFSEADPAEYVFNVTSGAVKVYKLLPDGRRQVTGFLFPGDFLGLTHNEVYAYTAEALAPMTVCRFPRQKLEALLDEFPILERRLLGMASHELAAAQDQMVLLGRKTARERLISFLLNLSRAQERHGRSDNPVDLPMGRTDIADYLGLTIETVSRTFTQLRKDGLIQLLEGGSVRLVKTERLQSEAEDL
jgi:CRP/FNR family transcriptional regulator